MKLTSLFSTFLTLLLLAGCATHAKIEVPVTSKVIAEQWQHKDFRCEIFYSQPEPGIFNSGTQEPLKPLSESKLTIGSAQVLANLPQMVAYQLPLNTFLTDKQDADYCFRVELVAHHKGGPTYSDFEFGKSLAKSFVSLGMASDEYNIIADFDVTYSLTDANGNVFKKDYHVKDCVDHERGSYEFKNNTLDYAAELLRKHIMITSSAFLSEASAKI